MEMQEAVKAVRALANGVDPVTGEIFGEDSPYQKPQVILALQLALHRMEAEPSASVSNTPPTSAQPGTVPFVPWTEEEDERLCQAFYRMVAFDEIASAHGRTRPAIISRLIGLGKIKPKAHQVA